MKKIKDFIKRNYLIIIVAICFFAFVPPITNLLVTTSSPIGFITPDNQETWIGFFGSIIGGGATLFGVWWTIKKQEEQRENDLAIQYKPIIDIVRDTSHDDYFNKFYVREELNEFYFPIIITNIGRGEALNITIKTYFSKNTQYKTRKNFLYKEKNFQNFIIVPIKYLQQTSYTQDDGNVSECYKLNYFITVEYSDAFNNKYSDTFQIKFEISKEFDIILQDNIEKID